jgi:CysZ protein
VAARRLEPDAMRVVFRNKLGRLWLCGAVINLLFQIPLLNLTAPVVATSFMVHVFQSLRKE